MAGQKIKYRFQDTLEQGVRPYLKPKPVNKSHHSYQQGVETILKKKDFTKADFDDVQAKSDLGANLLHFAASKNNSTAVLKLIEFGVDPLCQNTKGQTPLKLACQLGCKDSVKTLVDHHLAQHPGIEKYTNFTLFKAKGDGITLGGFYHDCKGDKWLVKEGHHHCADAVVKEYIAGGLYQQFLGANAPQTEMVIDNLHGALLTASKLLPNFKTLSEYTQNNGFGYNPYNWSPYGPDFPATINGKKVEGFMDGISSIIFMRDTDAHQKNTGLIDHGDHYSFAKIDHGFSFNFSYFGKASLDDFRIHLKQFYNIDNLEQVGFNDVYQSVSKIGNLHFSVIENTVTEKMSKVKAHMQVLELNNPHEDYHHTQHGTLDAQLKDYQTKLLTNLKDQHHNFQKIANFMDMEKAIMDHDASKLSQVMDKGVKLNEPFKQFFNPTYDKWLHETKSVTGNDLVKKHWPELLDSNPLKTDDKGAVLTMQDIFGGNENAAGNNIQQLFGMMLQPVIEVFQPAAVHVEMA